jgi:hypothetical protein
MIEQQAQDKLNQFIVDMVEQLERGAAFAGEQIPLVLQEVLLWHSIRSGIIFVVGAAVLISSIYVAYKMIMKSIADNENRTRLHKDYLGLCFPAGLIAFLGGIAGLVMTIGNLTWLQIIIAPRLYLIEWATSLL